MCLPCLPQLRARLSQSRDEGRPAFVFAPTLLQHVRRLMRQVMHVGGARMLLRKQLHTAVEIRTLVRDDLPRRPRPLGGTLQLHGHRLLRRVFHQRQANQVQITLSQRPFPQRRLAPQTTHDHQ
jgi:hypothetical protein